MNGKCTSARSALFFVAAASAYAAADLQLAIVTAYTLRFPAGDFGPIDSSEFSNGIHVR